jgi:hypothetical protein
MGEAEETSIGREKGERGQATFLVSFSARKGDSLFHRVHRKELPSSSIARLDIVREMRLPKTTKTSLSPFFFRLMIL